METPEEVAAREAGEAAAAEAAEAERIAAEEAARIAAEQETPEQKAAKQAEADRNKRYSEVTKQRDEALRAKAESDRMAQLALETLQKSQKPADKPVEDEKPVPPKFADFNDPDEFSKAMADHTEKLTDWKVKQALPAHVAEQEKKAQANREKSESERVEADYQANRTKALADLPDFEEIAENPDLQISPSMAAAMKQTGELAPKILYHLGQNPAEAARIAKLPPGMQFMEIGALKAALAKPSAKPKPLPAPIIPQGGGRSTSKTMEEMSMDEYAAHRKEQIKAERAAR